MVRLSEILARRSVASQSSTIHLAELYREQERFEEAQLAMDVLEKSQVDVTRKLISTLIQEKNAAPIRYRM